MNLHLLLLPGVLDGSLGVALDAAHTANRLRRASGLPEIFSIRIVAPTGRSQTTAAGLSVGRAGPLPVLRKNDLIVVPGANQPTTADVEAWLGTRAVRKAVQWLAGARDADAHVAAACTGTFVAAEAGLLAGNRATTTWWLAAPFRQRYPAVTLDLEHMVVSAGRVTTAGAALAQADLMLVLIRQFGSARLASACARYLLMDRRDSQSRYPMLSHLTRQDPFLLKLEELMEARLAQPFSMVDLASAMRVSARTLARRVHAAIGLSPMDLLQRLRTERAVHLMETSDVSVDEVAARVGYSDAATLRRLMKRRLGIGPSALRRQHRLARAE